MTLNEWILGRIKTASITAKKGRFYDTRIRAAEREKTLKSVLAELKLAGLDMNHLKKRQS